MNHQMLPKMITIYSLFSMVIYCQEEPLIVPLALAGKNPSTSTIVRSVLANANGLRRTIGWVNAAYLARHAWTLADWGEEIAQNTYGIGNVVDKLIKRIESDLDLPLPQETLREMVNVAVIPEPNNNVVQKLLALKENRTLYAVSNQDELEHQIFSKKMFERHKIDLPSIFDRTFIAPAATCEDAISQAHRFLKRPFLVIDTIDELLKISAKNTL